MSGGNAPVPVLSPREAALRAVELRARALAPPTPSASSAHADLLSATPFTPSAPDKLKFHRIIDTQLYPKTSSVQRVSTLDTLLKLTSNILTPPEGSTTSAAAYKRIRMSNSLVKRHLVDAGGGAGYDYLVECGFRSVKEEFEHFLIFPSSPSPKQLHSLRVGNFVINQVLAVAAATVERENRFKMSEADQNAARVGKAMLGFEEDRRLKRERDERDKNVRNSKARAAAELAAMGPPEVDEDHPLFHTRSDGTTMALDNAAEAGGPPSYGALHGYVLGTGEAVNVPAPAGVNMINQQELDGIEEERRLFGDEEGQFFYEDHYDSEDNPITPPPGAPGPRGR